MPSAPSIEGRSGGSTDAPTTVPASDPPAALGDLRLPVGRQIAAFLLILAAGAAGVIFLPPVIIGGIMIAFSILYLARRLIFSWVGGLGILLGTIMFIPVRRYALPIPLPFALEPYRVVIVILLVAVLAALLLDKKRTWQPVRFGWPVGIFFASLAISIPFNGTSLVEEQLGTAAVGALANYALLLSTMYIVRQLLTTERIALGFVTALVWCGTVVAFLAIIERATRFNLFLRLQTVLPLIQLRDEAEAFRAGGYRSYASSQHPIALSVLFCMLIPLAIYLATHSRRPENPWNRRIVYSLAAFTLLGGVLAAVSRTAVVVLAVMLIVTLIFRPWLGVTMIALGIPLLLVGMAALPKVIGTLVLSFLDIDSLLASQQTSPGFRGAGRLADLGPSLAEFVIKPFFGTGLGSRIVVGDEQNAYILDNQVLGTMLETGVVGLIGVIALTVVPVIMLLRWTLTVGRTDPRYGMLGFALVVSGAGYIAALFFYDAFGFYQTLFVLLMLYAVAGWLMTASPPALEARARREAPTMTVAPA